MESSLIRHTCVIKTASIMARKSPLKYADLHRKPKKVKITLFDKIFDVAIKFDVQTQSYFKNGSAVNSRIERTNGQMGQYSFETLI